MSFDEATKRVSQVVETIKRQFGDESGVQITNSDIFRWINDGQREISVQLSPLKARAKTVLIPNQKDYMLPSENIIQTDAVTIDGIKLPFKNFQEALEEATEISQVGRPAYYTTWGSEVSFYPVPDSGYTVEFYYSKYPEEITSEGDVLNIPDRFYDALISYIMGKAAELDEEFDVAASHQGMFAARITDQQDFEYNAQNSQYPRMTIFEED